MSISSIATQIATKIAAKAVASPDPTKILADDLAAILTGFLTEIQALTGTNSDSFFIGNSDGQDQEGYRLLGFRVNETGHKVAIGLHFDESVTPAVYELQSCMDYTGTGSDVWEPFGVYAEATKTASGLMSVINYKKTLQLPPVNFDEFEIIVSPKLSVVGASLNSTAGSVRYMGTVYTVPARTNINGGLTSYVNKQFFGYIERGGTTFATNAGLVLPIGDPIIEDTTDWNYVYFGFYKYTGGVLTQIPITPTLSAKLPDGTRAVTDGNGELDLSGLSTGGGIAYKTGTVVDFEARETHFGSEAAPETGNITADIGSAGVGHMAFMTHNSGTEPTFSSIFHKISGSDDYEPGVNNYIYFDYRSATRINYSITQ